MRQLYLFFLALVALPALISRAETAAAQTDWQFGVIEAYDAPQAAASLGVGWTRIKFQWADVQAAGPESWTPKVSDAQIEAERAAGRMVVGLLIGIPDWARDANRLPQGLWLEPDDPGNTWATFVRTAMARYAGRIDHWVIWNEPDIDIDAIAHTWDGSVDDFYQLQRTAYLVAKETNPDAIIHLAAFTYWADVYAGREQYMARLLDRILADPAAYRHNHYFDVATAHLYFQPNQIYDLVTLFRDIMAQRGLDKPLWLVETNAPPHDDPSWRVPNWTLSVTVNEQAAFMPQAVAAALAAGAQRIGVYKLIDTPDDRAANPEPFGLLRRDGSRRPAFITYQVAIRMLGGATEATRERWNEVGQIRVTQADRTTTVLFARLPLPQRAQVTAVASEALLINMWGSARRITAVDGVFTVDLQPALCTQPIGDYCMIGGTTYYLVQARDDSAPPVDPPPRASPPAIVTATVAPTATAAPTATPPPTSTATTTPPVLAAAPPTAVAPTGVAPMAVAPTSTPPTAAPPRAPQTLAGQTGLLLLGAGILGALVLGLLWRRMAPQP